MVEDKSTPWSNHKSEFEAAKASDEWVWKHVEAGGAITGRCPVKINFNDQKRYERLPKEIQDKLVFLQNENLNIANSDIGVKIYIFSVDVQ